jgi:hypothetical protein
VIEASGKAAERERDSAKPQAAERERDSAKPQAAERERDSAKPQALIVQSDCSVLLEVYSPMAEDARAAIAPFTELVKSPEHVHTYRITPLSIWNARAAGFEALQMVAALREHARYVTEFRRVSSGRSSIWPAVTVASLSLGRKTHCVAGASTK